MIADFIAWLIRSDAVKGSAEYPIPDPAHLSIMLQSSVIFALAFLYLMLGAIYMLVFYGNRIYLRTKVTLICFAALCGSISLAASSRLYVYWYHDFAALNVMLATLSVIVILIAIILTVFEFQARHNSTKKELGFLSEKVREVVERHGHK